MSAHPPRPLLAAVALVFVLLGSLGAGSTGTAASLPAEKTLTFEATVHQGPDRTLTLTGTLQVHLDRTGMLTGALRRSRGTPLPASGQVTGNAINLAFLLGRQQYIFGVGTSAYDATRGRIVMGGPFVGPRAADSGAWLAMCVSGGDTAKGGGTPMVPAVSRATEHVTTRPGITPLAPLCAAASFLACCK